MPVGSIYGEDGHKGVDFPAIEGTDVRAVADGVVMDVVEGWPNGDSADNGFGNLVLIRHTKQHRVRHNNGQMIGQWGFVYSIYAHLSQYSVVPNEGDTVTAGEKIAEVDDTGKSTGNHLHLQIVLDPSPDHDDGADYPWTETTSRNPEAWLAPFNNGTIQTASVIGKVTDANGNPVPNLRIYGMEKPDGAIWNPSAYPYGYSETYNDDKENPDDILVENFATTDVDPGTYDLVAKHKVGDQWVVYEQLGSHTFTAGQTTYIGLYPVYLSDIMENYYGWNSSIVVRNNSDSKTAQVNTTFFRYDGEWVYKQKTDYIAPQGTVVVDFPGTCYYCRGSALVAASEDVSVVVMNIHDAYPYTAGSYTGLASTSSTVHLPLLHRNNYGWYSDFTVFNTGSTPTDFTVTFTPATAGYSCTQTYYNVPPSGSRNVDLTYVTCVGSTFVGGARVTSSNGQPLAAVANQWKDYTGDGVVESFMSYEGFLTAFDPLPLPLLMRNNCNWDTGLVLQNAAGSSNSVALFYYRQSTTNNGAWCRTDSYTLSANGVQVVNPAPPDDGCTSGGATFVGAGLGSMLQTISSKRRHLWRNFRLQARSGQRPSSVW